MVVVELPHPALPGKARNEGVKLARGDYVSFPGSHVELRHGSFAARMAAHQQGHAMVTGAIFNGTDTPAGWASYFMDHCASLPARPSGMLDSPPNSCSYDRRALIASGLFPEDRRAGEDTVVNQRLWDAGCRAYRDNRIELTHITRCTPPWRLARHHFNRGWGRILRETGRGPGELAGYVGRRLSAIENRVRRWGEGVSDRYDEVQSLTRLGVTIGVARRANELAVSRGTAQASVDHPAPPLRRTSGHCS